MDPATISAIMSAIGPLLQAFTGNQGKMGSTFNKGGLSLIDQIQQQVKGGMGGPQQDITQAPGYQAGNEWLQSMFSDPNFFKNVEAPAMRQFDELQGDIGNRFAGMGSGGSTGSTGFRNVLAREGQNLATNLSAQRTGMQQQAIPQMLGYAQQPNQNWMQQLQAALTPTQNVYQPGMFG